MHKNVGKKEICANFAIASQTVNVTTTVYDSGLVNKEHVQDYRIQYYRWGFLEYIPPWIRGNSHTFVCFQRLSDLPVTHRKFWPM